MERLIDQGSVTTLDSCKIATYGNLQYQLAQREHEPELRRALRENTIPGWISLSYEREPDYFFAASLEGDIHDTVIGLDLASGKIMGIGTRSVQKRFVEELATNIGYLGQLRVSRDYRNKLRALKYGFQYYRQFLHNDASAPYYLTSIISDNDRAKRLLTSNLNGYPTYRYFGTLNTLAIPTRAQKIQNISANINLQIATPDDIEDIVACLNRNNQRFQFASYWTVKDLESNSRCRGLSINDFLLAKENNRIVGCLALWDQSKFKQVIVRDYNRLIKRGRPIINAFSRILGYPSLPQVDTPVSQVYISHLAVDDDDDSVAMPLLKFATNIAARKNHNLVLLGLSQKHPSLPRIKRSFKHIGYTSYIYLVYWDDLPFDIEQLKRRVLHLDIAVL